MIRTTIETRLAYDVFTPTHFRMHLAAMSSPLQHLPKEDLFVHDLVGTPLEVREFTDPNGNRMHRFDAAPGGVRLTYSVEVEHRPVELTDELIEHRISDMPDELLHWMTPTRFCEVDKLGNFAISQFGQIAPGVGRVQAVVDWVRTNITYVVGSSGGLTTAADVLAQRAGVCRDFAHLSITLCRALNIPARLVAGYVIFDEPPQDFHAIFEVWLGRWIPFDPTGLAPTDRFVRVGVGSDAKDVAFATTFGQVAMTGMEIDLFDEDDATGERRVADSSTYVQAMPPSMVRPSNTPGATLLANPSIPRGERLIS